MYYHLSKHIYIAQFRDEFILLDAKEDRYVVCFKEFSHLLGKLFEYNFKLQACAVKLSLQEENLLQQLLNDQVIERKNFPYSFSIDRKFTSDGVPNVDWSLPLNNIKIGISLQVVKALLTLIKVNFYMKFRGLYTAIQLIKNKRKRKNCYFFPRNEELEKLAAIVNKACSLYPQRTKCLEWAMTYVILALKRNWKCNFEIGVQNYPFVAHAWVECNEQVVMDSQDLRKGLAIILNEPFRKLKM